MASSIFSTHNRTGQIAVVRSRQPTVQVSNQRALVDDLGPTMKHFNDFWELMATIKKHGYLRAAMAVVGRSAVGAWWALRKHPELGEDAPDRHRRRLYDFYTYRNRQWDNIKDYQNIAYKLMIGAQYLRYFGQAAYQIIRDENGHPLGFDFLHGLVVPNVDSSGFFKSPAFIQYPTPNPTVKVPFENPRDIIYMMNPDWEGSPMGGTDIESLSSFTLPIDLYLMLAAREYLKNRDTPEVVYSLPADASDEAFNAFVENMEANHAGAANLGKNPIAVQGEFAIHELRPLPAALPYQTSRKDAREEELAVAGVNGAKLGLSEYLSSANLKEMRREFHETSLVPLFMFIEISLYEQAHVREFNYPGWVFKFNSPDFLNAVERATVHMRYKQMSALTPNEIRYDLGKPKRTDENGDKFEDQKPAKGSAGPVDPPGSPPEGRPVEPDAPSQTGEPTLDDQDPPRGDQHDEETRQNMLAELRLWRTFAQKRAKAGKFPIREFKTVVVPDDVRGLIQGKLDKAMSFAEVAGVFFEVFDLLSEVLDGLGDI